MTMTIAEQWAEFTASTTFDALPEEVVESVKMRVLDTVGIAVRASTLETSQAALRWANETGNSPEASVAGAGVRLPAALAAFVNGVQAHSLDYDDTHLPSVLHPSASVVPAALAVAERYGRSGQDLIRAIALGLEMTVRLGMAGYDPASRSSVFFDRGQHATSICGTIGAAVAASVLIDPDDPAPIVLGAMGIAASFGAGILEGNRTGGNVKRVHCGWAAQGGVSAAHLSAYGITGPPTVFEGRFGFLQAWLGENSDPQAIVEELGSHWTVPEIFFKAYPANHFTHTVLDAAAAMRSDGVRPGDVEAVVVRVPESVVRTIGEPIEVKRAPASGYMAQFSGPYAVAVGLFGGAGLGASLEDYTDELATDPERLALMSKVTVVADALCTEIFPNQFPAIVEARLRDGRLIEKQVLITRGGQDRPLSFDELTLKFDENTAGILSDRARAEFKMQCRDLHLCDDVRNFGALYSQAGDGATP